MRLREIEDFLEQAISGQDSHPDVLRCYFHTKVRAPDELMDQILTRNFAQGREAF